MKVFIENIFSIKYACLLFFLLAMLNEGFAQNQISFEHISTKDGLSQSDVNTIYQDEFGFMWFGTHDGLNKYDGYGFTVYNPDHEKQSSINSNLIFDIVGDDDGNLWIATTGRGINFFNAATGKFTHYVHDEEDPSSLVNNHVTVIFKDSKKRLWIGTQQGLDMLDLSSSSEKLEFQHFSSEQEPFVSGWDGTSIFTIYEDKKGQLLVGGTSGLFKLNKDTNGKDYFGNINKNLGLPDVNVRGIAEDSTGRLFVATNTGLYSHIKGSGKTMQKWYDGYFSVLLIDKNNRLWAGSNDGLYLFENTSQATFPKFLNRFVYDSRNPNSLSKNIVRSLYEDDTGIIWIGTNGGGINTYDPDRKQFKHIRNTSAPNSLSYDKIRAMFEDSNGTLWIGTEGGGLNMLDQKDDNGSYSSFKHFSSISRIFALTEVRIGDKKKLFIGTEGTPSLFQLDITDPKKTSEKELVTEELRHSVFSLLTDTQENIWIGTYGSGVHRWMKTDMPNQYIKDTFAFYPGVINSVPSNIIRNIFEDSVGNIWLGTANGLCKIPAKERYKKAPKILVYKNDPKYPGSLSHNYILSLYESTSGDLWVGTFGGGLNKLVSSNDNNLNTFVSYSERDGLPNNVIKGILEDATGNLWLSTNQGLSKFDPKRKTFKNYSSSDGLQNNEFQELACVKRADGEMLFGGINGFNAFYPNEISDNEYLAQTVITNLLISNKTVGIGEKIKGRVILEKNINKTEEIQLKYRENSFSFEFAALHYSAPSKNQFAYRLEGFDSDWTLTSSKKRFATYTNLEPGSYTFKVKASNNDGLWSDTATQLKVNIIPPFWRTTMAYIIYVLLLLGLLWLFWRYTFIRTSEKHQLELEHLEKERSEQLQKMKLEFFTNISHEFRTPLTLIKGPLEYLQKNVGTMNQASLKEQLGIMQKNTSYLLRLVGQLLDFRKLNQGKMRLVMRNSNVSTFIKEVGEPFQFIASKQSLDFKIESSNENLMAWFDHQALEKIINNLLSNAFKFTKSGDTIKIKISEKTEEGSDLVVVKVKDSGMGIPKNKISNIFERFHSGKDNSKMNPEGMGIGLAFTKNLIELHQGSIDVISEPNKGTTFTVKLPKDRRAYQDIKEITCKEVSDNDFLVRTSETESFAIGLNDDLIDQSLHNERSNLPVLLLVDDNPDIRAFIKQVLAKSYTIFEAENGKQGLDIANKIVPNVVICDILMPVMDGIEFCQKMKSRTETSHIPIIILTAKSSQESELQGLQLGVDEYLRKPFGFEVLELKLSNIVKRREQLRKKFNREIALTPSEVTVTTMDERFLGQAIDIVEQNMMNTDFNVEMLVREMGLSRSNLYLKFKELTGLSSSGFIRNVRLKRAVQLFDTSDLSVKEIMYMTGFNTASYFSKCFKKQFGIVPSEYVRQTGPKTKPMPR
ncbi:hybrid sensor histidine kinase/response regulator transcription factor [Flagellimonas algicola]|uniref:histidine kinase n=1 Tax=Flagellimonas algicola TaxID=2583815 RepID=A0ABY2WQK5_9FLAO|nr:two-component regulator propeller domain-containing protein [Allomuricauda algicola]TMU57288.1 response regulator [Allomuricauda algicola]